MALQSGHLRLKWHCSLDTLVKVALQSGHLGLKWHCSLDTLVKVALQSGHLRLKRHCSLDTWGVSALRHTDVFVNHDSHLYFIVMRILVTCM